MPVVLLDSGPVGLITNPLAKAANRECAEWLRTLARERVRVILPEIVDYEIRRELLRSRKLAGLRQLDTLRHVTEYLPITTAAMRQAAQFWAEARQRGRPTAAPDALDGDVILGDVILARQVATLDAFGELAVVATTNAAHLAQYVDARDWRTIA